MSHDPKPLHLQRESRHRVLTTEGQSKVTAKSGTGRWPSVNATSPGTYVRTAGGRITVKNGEYFETVRLKDGRKFYLPYFSFVLVNESDE